MAYTNHTQFFGIPVMGAGDLLTEEQEVEQMGILDSLLYALSYGCKTLIVEEGNYSIVDGRLTISPAILVDGSERIEEQSNSGSGSSASESAEQISEDSANSYSLMGIVNGRMFASQRTIVVDRLLYADTKYYVYVEYNDALNFNPSEFSVSVYNMRQGTSDARMLICTVEGTSNGSSVSWQIDTDLPEKVYSSNIVSHTADSTNPHGALLVQSNLQVSNEITLKGNSVAGAIYGSYVTNGSDGVTEQIETSGTVAFVACYPEDASAGTIAWSISGNSVTFTNSGATGITVNYKVDVL